VASRVGGVGGVAGASATAGCTGLFACGPAENEAARIAEEGDCLEVEGTVDVAETRESEYDAVVDESSSELS